MATFTFLEPMHNAALVEATKVKGTNDYAPILSTDIRIILRWFDKQGNNIGYIRLYPNPSGDVISEHGDGDADLLYDDPIYNIFVTKDQKQTRNFFQQLNIERILLGGANTITLTLFDPRGNVIDNTIMLAYIKGLTSNNMSSNITISLVYGWGNSDLKEWGAPIGGNMILSGVNVNTEYFGTSYTLTFSDNTSLKYNTKIQGWQTLQPEGQSQTAGGSGDVITFPQALVEAWKLQHKAKLDVFGNGGQTYILASSVNKEFLAKEVYEGTGSWPGKTKTYADWNPSDKIFEAWVNECLSNDFPDDSKIKYTYKSTSSGDKLPGTPDDYWVFNGESWQEFKKILNGRDVQKNDQGFKVPFNASFISLCVDVLQATANSQTMPMPNEVIKYFIYATTIRSPHATILKLDVAANDVLPLYMGRDTTKWISKEHIPETDKPTEKDIIAGTTLLSDPSGDAAGKASPKQDSPADPKSTSNAQQGESAKNASNIAMNTLTLTMEVLGDPDLCGCLQKYIIIDFDQYAQSLLSWVAGVYLVVGISEYLTNGMWTMSLQLQKTADLPPGLELNKNTGLLNTPSPIELVFSPYQASLSFLKVTNYLEWLMGALGLAEILGNLIGGVVSSLSSIYGGISSMFSNEELANITNTIQNSSGGKSYGNNYQNLGSNTSQNSTQQYYQAQAQTTKEVLSDYFENFSKLDDIEDVAVRKDVAMLGTKFGGDMVRNEVIEMQAVGEEVTVEAIKDRLIKSKKWYRTGDRNFAVNMKNFSLKRLKMPIPPSSSDTNQLS